MTDDQILQELYYQDLLEKRGVDKEYAQELAERIARSIQMESRDSGDAPSIVGEGCIGRDLSSEPVIESHTLSDKESVTECHELKEK